MDFPSMEADDFDRDAFDARHEALADDLTNDLTIDWRWGEQVHIEPFFGAGTGRARGRWARYLAKYLTKSTGLPPAASDEERAHHVALLAAAKMLPCHVHGRYRCDCAKHQAVVEQYGFRGNVIVTSRNWGCTFKEVRRARTRATVKACIWRVVGAGYPTGLAASIRQRIAQAERALRDKRRAHRKAVPPTAGPDAP